MSGSVQQSQQVWNVWLLCPLLHLLSQQVGALYNLLKRLLLLPQLSLQIIVHCAGICLSRRPSSGGGFYTCMCKLS
jgi:hypothetical protein